MAWHTLVTGLVERARATRQRAVMVLAGGRQWGSVAAHDALAICGFTEVLWITTAAPPNVRAVHGAQAHHLLGSEVDAVVFDIYSGMDVEAFGAVVGAVRAGGVFLLLAPPRAAWSHFADPEQARIAVHPVPPEQVTTRFLQRFLRELTQAEGVTWVEEGHPLPSVPQRAQPIARPPEPDDQGCLTADQRTAHDAIVALLEHNMPRDHALVLTSDRGRGKSAALGIAAATLLRRNCLSRIIVTAPRFDAAATLFAHAQQHLPAAQRARDVVRYRDARLQFVAPDALGASDPSPELLLVDEAAAIPLPMLERMLDLPIPIVFATTVHGYEGSGRGFATRFQATLDARRQARGLRLEEPVRWAKGDPLEQFAFRALLLDGSPANDLAAERGAQEACRFESVDRDRLLADDALLGQVFGLLVLAHYRTSPLDLRFLLDGPNLTVWIARCGTEIIGAALVAAEGGFDEPLARAVWEGRRRPRGHLLAQSLAVHAGFHEAPTLRFLRIVRLAVHPAAQGCGIGGRLLEAICATAQGSADAVGSSFGASPRLLDFWQQHGFRAVRLGLTREAASGAPAIMVLRPISSAGEALFDEAHARYCDVLPHLLADPLRNLEPELTAALRESPTCQAPERLNMRDWRELAAYVAGRRELELVYGPIMRLVGEEVLTHVEPGMRALVEAKLRYHKSWPELVRAFHFRGRGQAAAALRQALSPMIEALGGTQVSGEIEALGGPTSE